MTSQELVDWARSLVLETKAHHRTYHDHVDKFLLELVRTKAALELAKKFVKKSGDTQTLDAIENLESSEDLFKIIHGG